MDTNLLQFLQTQCRATVDLPACRTQRAHQDNVNSNHKDQF